MSKIHPYFLSKARDVCIQASGDPANAAALAAWAQEARDVNDSRRGVIVAEDGSLIAETYFYPGGPDTPGATYLTPADTKRYELFGNELGIALGALSRITGQHLIHVRMSEVCSGAGKKENQS